MWAYGCVLAEMLLLRPLLPGTSSTNQLILTMRLRGTPTPAQVRDMNPNYPFLDAASLPKLPKRDLSTVLPPRTPSGLTQLVDDLLVYSPSQRHTAQQVRSYLADVLLISMQSLELLFNIAVCRL